MWELFGLGRKKREVSEEGKIYRILKKETTI